MDRVAQPSNVQATGNSGHVLSGCDQGQRGRYFQKPGLFGKSELGGAVQVDYIQLLRTMKDADRSRLVCQVHDGRMGQTYSEEGWGIMGLSEDHSFCKCPCLFQQEARAQLELPSSGCLF